MEWDTRCEDEWQGPHPDPHVPMCVVQSLSRVWLVAIPRNAASQAPLCFTISPSLLRFTSIESVTLSNHHALCCPFLKAGGPSVFPTIRVFSDESALHIRWPKYWSFSFSISPSKMNIEGWFPLVWTGVTYSQSKGLSRDFSSTTIQKHQFFSTQLSL